MTTPRPLDDALAALAVWLRRRPLCYRLTLGTRLLLAAGFVPTGLVKLLGMRFTAISPEVPLGAFFEALYQSGLYWRFLGLAQVVAGALVLVPATATVGALAFFAILLNIFVITLSFDFRGTPFVTGAMVGAALYLLLWDYHRLRGLFGAVEPAASPRLPSPRLSGAFERAVYAVGGAAGMAFFLATRGLLVPPAWGMSALAVATVAVLLALALGWRHRRLSAVT